MIRPLLLALALVISASGPAAAAPPSDLQPTSVECRMAPADAAWLEGALRAWRRTAEAHLRIDASVPPTFLLYDEACVWRADPPGQTGIGAGQPVPGPGFWGRPLAWRAAPHGGTVILPDGKRIPPGVASFAAPWDENRQVYFVMALPSVWRAAGISSELTLEKMLTGVLLHEMTHTRQFYGFSPLMARLSARWALPPEISDDSLQDRFKADPAYVAAWGKERDLLYAAAAAPDPAQARALAHQALQAAEARRARWFVGDDAKWAEVEDAFLTLEGLGQWAAYAWLTDPQGGAIAPAQALPGFRRGGKYWSQDQGLALFLVIDRLVPDWRMRAFAADPAGAFELWRLAAK